MSVELKGAVGELRFTVQVTRKETGKVETFEMTSQVDAAKLKELQDAKILTKENDDGRNS